MNTNMTPLILVYLFVRSVRPRAATFPTPPRYRAAWVARGTGGEVYASKTCDTVAEAKQLAQKWLSRNSDRVTVAS